MPVLKTIAEKRTEMDRVIIFCQKRELCSYLYLYFKSTLGAAFTEPVGAPCISCFRID